MTMVLIFLTSDIDECILELDDCSGDSNCHNLNGSYSCGVEPVIEIREPSIITLNILIYFVVTSSQI